MKKVTKTLKERGDIKPATTLKNVFKKEAIVSANDAFELGLALQSLLDHETEFSNTGVSVSKITEAIDFVKSNIQQDIFA